MNFEIVQQLGDLAIDLGFSGSATCLSIAHLGEDFATRPVNRDDSLVASVNLGCTCGSIHSGVMNSSYTGSRRRSSNPRDAATSPRRSSAGQGRSGFT